MHRHASTSSSTRWCMVFVFLCVTCSCARHAKLVKARTPQLSSRYGEPACVRLQDLTGLGWLKSGMKPPFKAKLWKFSALLNES